jgi:hypothetical protein
LIWILRKIAWYWKLEQIWQLGRQEKRMVFLLMLDVVVKVQQVGGQVAKVAETQNSPPKLRRDFSTLQSRITGKHHRQASPASITARQITCPSSENPLNLDQFADLLLLLPTKILFQNSGRLENHTQSSIFHLKKPP